MKKETFSLSEVFSHYLSNYPAVQHDLRRVNVIIARAILMRFQWRNTRCSLRCTCLKSKSKFYLVSNRYGSRQINDGSIKNMLSIHFIKIMWLKSQRCHRKKVSICNCVDDVSPFQEFEIALIISIYAERVPDVFLFSREKIVLIRKIFMIECHRTLRKFLWTDLGLTISGLTPGFMFEKGSEMIR